MTSADQDAADGEPIEDVACGRCGTTRSRDWARGATAFFIWWLPGALLLLSVFVGGSYRLALWPAALAWMGVACLLNARNCQRLHCYFTGPYFLLLGLIGVLHGIGTLPLGSYGWAILSAAFVVGGLALTYIPERLHGRYRKPSESFFRQ
jgi:hypothetical protein